MAVHSIVCHMMTNIVRLKFESFSSKKFWKSSTIQIYQNYITESSCDTISEWTPSHKSQNHYDLKKKQTTIYTYTQCIMVKKQLTMDNIDIHSLETYYYYPTPYQYNLNLSLCTQKNDKLYNPKNNINMRIEKNGPKNT